MLKETLSEHGIMHPPNERFSCLPAARALPPPLLPPYRVPPVIWLGSGGLGGSIYRTVLVPYSSRLCGY